ncbi:MAG TPA: RecX family transcriptional regulator [Clostridiaceae bacterium]|nr:RecX family transcriptional regulator [Clostridiaceae bacterium]
MIDLSAFHQAREMAVAYIGIDYSKSSGKVRDNLRKKGVADVLAEQVIEYLKSIDYINDHRAARRVARRYEGRRLRSRRAMVYVFIQNGIDFDIANDEANRLPDDCETALQLCEATFSEREDVEDVDIMKLLTRRGYHTTIAREVIRKFKKT